MHILENVSYSARVGSVSGFEPGVGDDLSYDSPRPVTRSEPVPGTQAIRRALDVLGAFTHGEVEMSISDLASACSLSPSTAHRICRALVAEGFLQQDEPTARYSLGHAAVLLGQLAQRNYGLDRALLLLKEVGEMTGESVNLGIHVDQAAMVLLRVESPHPLRFEQPPGTRVPLHASSMGKLFLAFSPDPDAVVRGLSHLPRFTPSTLCDRGTLLADLRQICERGYSVDDQEAILGVRCVGAPILDRQSNAVAAVAIQVPAPRFPDGRMEELTSLVVDLARRLRLVLPLDRAPFSMEISA